MRVMNKTILDKVAVAGDETVPVNPASTELHVLVLLAAGDSPVVDYTVSGTVRSLGNVVELASVSNLQSVSGRFKKHTIETPEVYDSITVNVSQYASPGSTTLSALLVQANRG